MPERRADLERYAGRAFAPDLLGAACQNFKRIRPGSQAGEADFALIGIHPILFQPVQAITKADGGFVRERQRRKRDAEGAPLERKRHRLGVGKGMHSPSRTRKHNGRRGIWRRMVGRPVMRQPLAGSHPHPAIRVGEERIAVAVVPNQPLRPPEIPPVRSVKEIDSLIPAHPDSAAMVGADERDLLGVNSVLASEVFRREVAAGVEPQPGHARVLAIVNPDLIGTGYGDARDMISQQSILRRKPGPAPVPPSGKAFAPSHPHHSLAVLR